MKTFLDCLVRKFYLFQSVHKLTSMNEFQYLSCSVKGPKSGYQYNHYRQINCGLCPPCLFCSISTQTVAGSHFSIKAGETRLPKWSPFERGLYKPMRFFLCALFFIPRECQFLSQVHELLQCQRHLSTKMPWKSMNKN